MNEYFNHKIFIAGSTGLVGSAIIQYLLKNYSNIQIKGAYNTTLPFIKDNRISYIQADLTKKEDCRKAVHGCNFAIMAASLSAGAKDALSSPYRQLTDNIVMDTMLLESLYFEGIKRVVYLSSATVYQEFDGYIKENDIDLNKEPHPSYKGVGWAKRSAEKFCQFWHDKYGMEIIIARCANIYGPYAKFNPEVSNFIPALIRKAVDKLDPFEVWGSPLVERDVIYSEDMARAVLLLLVNNDIKCDILNLGYGKTVTVNQVVEFALKYANHQTGKVVFTKKDCETIKVRALDCSKIKQLLNWSPIISLENGIKLTTQWWIQNKEIWKK